jgi:hypothetical protein
LIFLQCPMPYIKYKVLTTLIFDKMSWENIALIKMNYFLKTYNMLQTKIFGSVKIPSTCTYVTEQMIDLLHQFCFIHIAHQNINQLVMKTLMLKRVGILGVLIFTLVFIFTKEVTSSSLTLILTAKFPLIIKYYNTFTWISV